VLLVIGTRCLHSYDALPVKNCYQKISLPFPLPRLTALHTVKLHYGKKKLDLANNFNKYWSIQIIFGIVNLQSFQ